MVFVIDRDAFLIQSFVLNLMDIYMKRCFKCLKEKELSLFYKHKQMAQGVIGKCKECAKKDVKRNPKKEEYGKTEKGVIRVIYKSQKANSNRRNHPLPEYTKEQLKEFLYNNGFKNLFDKWVKSDYIKDKKPSVDRIDDFKPYSLDNIRLITWKENRHNQYNDIFSAKGTSGLRCFSVNQYDINFKFISNFVSFSSAERSIGLSRGSISASIKRGGLAGGYIWKKIIN